MGFVMNKASEVQVWDPWLRLCHWGIAFCILVGWGMQLLSHIDPILKEDLNLCLSLSLLGFALFRIIWGFIGPTHARFGDFIRSPSSAIGYLFLAVKGQAPRYIGHNPAGGLMALALTATIIGLASSGLMLTFDEFWGGWAESLHIACAEILTLFILLHLAGAIFSSFVQRENLIWAMLTGRKKAS